MNQALSSFINKNENRAVKWQEIITDMLDSNDYRYAEDTLAGILEHIEANNSVTDKQIEAVENIKAKPSNPDWDAPPF